MIVQKLIYVISRAIRRVKFETNLKYHEWYLCQISRTNHAIICLYYYPQNVVIFTCRYFKLSWNTTALSQSNCGKFSCRSIKHETNTNLIYHKDILAVVCLGVPLPTSQFNNSFRKSKTGPHPTISVRFCRVRL